MAPLSTSGPARSANGFNAASSRAILADTSLSAAPAEPSNSAASASSLALALGSRKCRPMAIAICRRRLLVIPCPQ